MATESQLRDLLVELERGAPTIQDVLDSLGLNDARPAAVPTRRGHRWAAAGAAAACVAVVVGVGTVAGVLSRTPAPASDRGVAAPARNDVLPKWHFAVDAVRGYTVSRDRIVPSEPVTSVTQLASVTATHGRVSGQLVVQSGESVVDTADLRAAADGSLGHRRVLQINGRAAYFVYGTTLTRQQIRNSTKEFTNSGPRPNPWVAATGYASNQPQLYWRLPGKGNAELFGTFGFRPATASWSNADALATMKRIAAATTSTAGDAVRVPFRLATDPVGLMPLTLLREPNGICLGYGTGTMTRATDPTWGWYELCRFEGNPPSDLTEADHPLATRTLADGTVLGLFAAGWPGQPTPITRAQAMTLLRDADISPALADHTTWLTVR